LENLVPLDREFNYESNARRIVSNGNVHVKIWNFKVSAGTSTNYELMVCMQHAQPDV
jgi:hypothetical protein